MKTLGEKIREVRKGLNLNQLDFALKIGLESAVAISQYESNSREPDINKLKIICKLGNISLDELLTGAKSNKYSTNPSQQLLNNVNDHMPIYTPANSDALFNSDQKINIEEAMGKAYKVLNAGTALSVALYMNIQQFAAALDTGQELKECKDLMKSMQQQIDALNHKVDRQIGRAHV